MQFHNVLVTGSAGLLGRHVVRELVGRCEVAGFDAKRAPEDIPQTVGDVTDAAAVRAACTGRDAVVHIAAIPNIWSGPSDRIMTVNVTGTWNVLQAAEDAGVRRVVVASSDAALGLHYNPPGYAPQYLPIDEDHPLRPVEFYSLSKEVTEAMGRSYANRGKLEVLAIRPTHIVFPLEYPELVARGADVQNYHLWTYVAPEDVAQGFRLALDVAKAPWQAFFVSAADGLNTRPTLDMLRERYGTLATIRNPDYFRANPLASLLDIRRARDVLGFEPTINWRTMAAATAAA